MVEECTGGEKDGDVFIAVYKLNVIKYHDGKYYKLSDSQLPEQTEKPKFKIEFDTATTCPKIKKKLEEDKKHLLSINSLEEEIEKMLGNKFAYNDFSQELFFIKNGYLFFGYLFDESHERVHFDGTRMRIFSDLKNKTLRLLSKSEMKRLRINKQREFLESSIKEMELKLKKLLNELKGLEKKK